MNRSENLQKIKQLPGCDLLVIGGGATGCGIALDAASRGISVVLAEQNDFAEGTSGRSSKLVHGGVRYLEMAVKQFDRGQYQLVKEGLHERFYFLRNAPHLSHPLPLISPVYRWTQLPYVWFGLKLYDRLSGQHSLGPSGFSNLSKTLQEFPLLQKKDLKGGIRYYDGQFNDSRMALALALSAAEHGALIANHLAVVDLPKAAGKLVGAVFEDRISGERFSLQAKAVVNATGPFVDKLRLLDDPNAQALLLVSSGVHIMLDESYPPPQAGMLLSETEDGRVLFVLPWQGRCMVGTTDQHAELSEHPPVRQDDIDYLLRHLQKVIDPPPSSANVSASWVGLRPLVQNPKAHDSARILRDFTIEESVSGLYSIAGGKWTSYRRMAEKLVDRVVEGRSFIAGHCKTKALPVTGAENWQPNGWWLLVDNFSLSEPVARYLHQSYGCHAERIAHLAAERYGQPLATGFPCLEAEVIHACQFELAERAIDILARRLPLALIDQRLAQQAAPRVLELMSMEKRWSSQRLAEEKSLIEKRLTVAL